MMATGGLWVCRAAVDARCLLRILRKEELLLSLRCTFMDEGRSAEESVKKHAILFVGFAEMEKTSCFSHPVG